ncbi:ABC transporter ATP-binding protein [Tengunoibacter tsumagoiensis]|uniref:Helicase n=1 Tax=Tengunoibacter tsumagoiensis TaxID=2014871 RepID=A0A402A8F2_9CHLR|nr:ABC transporter ATP-binding protein [Tengunoibacter tsumagoiensis]GCE15389.1 helicase [Tengunoibacter tsumagoiensis]
MVTSVTPRPSYSFLRYRRLWEQYIAPQWRLVSLLTIFLLTTIGLQLLTPFILGQFIDAVTHGRAADTLFVLAVVYLCVAFFARGVRVGETYTAERLAWITTNALRLDVARHCLRLDLSFHHQHTPGELIERVDGDVSMLNNLFSRFVLVLINSVLLTVGMLVVLLLIDLRIGLTLLVYTGCYLLVNILLSRIPPPYFVKARQAEAELFGFLEERLSGTEDIRANGAVDSVLHRLTFFLRQRFLLQRRAELVSQEVRGVRMLMYIIGTLIALGLDAYLYLSGTITLGIVYLIFAYTMQLWDPLREITHQIGDFQQAVAGLSRLDELLQTRTAIPDGELEQLPEGPLAISFETVSFGYQAAKPVLHAISFSLTPGTVLGVLGRTGSGKTTLTRLLLRFYDPDEGCIRLNGVDLKMIKLDVLRSRVAVVTQDVQLFHASVRNNLTLFDRSISDSAIEDALKTLGLLEWSQRLPQGLDTILRSGGESLSAGQAQLVALTRIFLAHPDLVILDEASSRLDPVTEALLDRAISGLLRGRTGIIIAHRLTTLKHVDEVMILERGRVGEYGPREQLAQGSESYYSRLLQVDDMEDAK